MPNINLTGTLNEAAMQVPGAYVNVLAPPAGAVPGVATDILGLVGSAVWGPVGAPVSVGSLAEFMASFGAPAARRYDLGTAVWVGGLQGVSDFACVRVTDGTDEAATIDIDTATVALTTAGSGFAVGDTISFGNGAVVKVTAISSSPAAGTPTAVSLVTPPTAYTSGSLAQSATSGSGTGASYTFTYAEALALTALYTGSLGNSLTAQVAPGTAPGSWKITLNIPNGAPETFDNITGSENALWTAMAAAINAGQGIARPPSKLCAAQAGSSTAAPLAQTYTLTGGTDGASGIATDDLVGTDGSSRLGMYALAGSGASIGVLVDCGDSTSWTTQLAFALASQTQMADCSESGDTLADFASTMASVGVQSPWFKAMLGDWVYFNDTINNQVRVLAPTSFYAAAKIAAGPQNSALNYAINGIVGTQKSIAGEQYSFADVQALVGARGDVIANNPPGGAYWACLTGLNTSASPVEYDDSYATLTDFLAQSLGGPAGGGQFVGKLATADEQRQAASAIAGLLQNMADAEPPLIGDSTGAAAIPYSVSIATNTNGVQVATVMAIYLTVVRFFVINLTAGSTVQVATTPQAAASAAQSLS